MDREAWLAAVHGVSKESDTIEQLNETKHSPQVAQIVKNLQNILPLVNNIVRLQLVIDIF